MTDNIFKEATNPPASTQTTGSVEALVGEGKKFATVEDLAKGKAEADAYIVQLQGEARGLRSDLDQRLSAEDLLAEIRKERKEQLSAAAAIEQGNTTPPQEPVDIASLVNQTIENREVQQTAAQNLSTVDTKMKELYGEKAQEVMVSKAKEAGVSVTFLQTIAEQSPKAFYNALGLSATKQTTPSATTGSVDTAAFHNQQPSGGLSTWADFEKLRTENPKLYWKPDTQNRLMRARQEKGESFGI